MKVAIIGQFWNSIVRRTRSNRREKKKGREGEEIRGSGQIGVLTGTNQRALSSRNVSFSFDSRWRKLFTWNNGNLSRRSLTDEVTIFIRRRISKKKFSARNEALWKGIGSARKKKINKIVCHDQLLLYSTERRRRKFIFSYKNVLCPWSQLNKQFKKYIYISYPSESSIRFLANATRSRTVNLFLLSSILRSYRIDNV